MNRNIFSKEPLPTQQMEQLGLLVDGELKLNHQDKMAFLAGRRTSLLQFKALSVEGVQLPALDAKISLTRNPEGKLEVMLHSIRNQEQDYPDELTDLEAEKLINGESTGIYRKVSKEGEPDKEYLFEYDPETREFVRTEPHELLVPDMVNNEALTPAQKERYRQGKEVELSDGTTFRFSGLDPAPFRANTFALIASLLLDGGISFLLYTGIRALTGAKQEEKDIAYSEGYKAALENLRISAEHIEKTEGLKGSEVMRSSSDEENRTYTRSGRSR